MMRLICAVLMCASQACAQERIDPTTIDLDVNVRKAFSENRDRMTAHYQSQLSMFAVDGERLNLSTLDALIALASSAQRGRFVGSFLGYDLDWDGQITRTEYNSVFSSDFPLAESNADAWEQGAASNDLNGDDVITLIELLAVAGREQPLKKIPTKLRYIDEMRHWDLDGDGYVSQSEITDIIAANVGE